MTRVDLFDKNLEGVIRNQEIQLARPITTGPETRCLGLQTIGHRVVCRSDAEGLAPIARCGFGYSKPVCGGAGRPRATSTHLLFINQQRTAVFVARSMADWPRYAATRPAQDHCRVPSLFPTPDLDHHPEARSKLAKIQTVNHATAVEIK